MMFTKVQFLFCALCVIQLLSFSSGENGNTKDTKSTDSKQIGDPSEDCFLTLKDFSDVYNKTCAKPKLSHLLQYFCEHTLKFLTRGCSEEIPPDTISELKTLLDQHFPDTGCDEIKMLLEIEHIPRSDLDTMDFESCPYVCISEEKFCQLFRRSLLLMPLKNSDKSDGEKPGDKQKDEDDEGKPADKKQKDENDEGKPADKKQKDENDDGMPADKKQKDENDDGKPADKKQKDENDDGKPADKKQKDENDDGKPADKKQKDWVQVPASSHFLAYFLTACVICIAGYVLYHNKQKIAAFIVEGRSRANGRSSRGGDYKLLQSNVEEAMSSLDKSVTTKNYIY